MTHRSDESSKITIPRLDYSNFSSQEADSQEAFSKDFVNSLSRFGFVTIINHPFTDDEIEQLFLWVR
jgi:isopenicillin N synthase-like dioxygenase